MVELRNGARDVRAGRGGDPRLPTPLLGSWGSLFFLLAEDPWGPSSNPSPSLLPPFLGEMPLTLQSLGFLLPSSTTEPGKLVPHEFRVARTLKATVSQKAVTCPKSGTELAAQGPGRLPGCGSRSTLGCNMETNSRETGIPSPSNLPW